ncbi:MAG: proton-conducting membrane transporter [Clostridia bacterium]|nr:proton-conducting membrane transporter [Clostridia bacterium]
MSFLLILPVLMPIAAGICVWLIPALNTSAHRSRITLATLFATLALLVPILLMGEMTLPLFTLSDNLPIFLHADALGKLFACVMAFVWAMAGMYSFEYMTHEGHEKRYHALNLMTLGVLMGLCFSGSIVTFYMFYEAMTLLTMPLVMHSGRKDAVAAGIKYLIYSVLGASLVLLGLFVLAPCMTGVSFIPGGALDASKAAGRESFILIFGFLMLAGFGAKAGLFPLHGWLPTAHPAAPSPASAVLSGVITKAGVLGVIRLIWYWLGAETLRGTWVQTTLIALALLTVLAGSLLAYREHHLKKRLAWSTVSQVSYVLLGLLTLSPAGFVGALLHVVCHSLCKDVLFMSAGSIILHTGETDVRRMTGLGRRMPVTLGCFAAAALGLVGIPPCLGFFSKWELAQAALSMADVPSFLNWLIPVVLLVSALLTAGYLLPIVLKGFFPGCNEDRAVCSPDAAAESWSMLIPMLVLAILSVLLGMFPGPLTALTADLAAMLM